MASKYNNPHPIKNTHITMKTTYVQYILAILLMAATAQLPAQTLHSAYFLESMVQRNELNPAFGAESNYIVVPVIGGSQIGIHSNVGMGNFFFQRGDKLVNGLSPQVTANEFLSGLPTNSQLELSVEIPLVSVGFHAWGGFNTVILKERSFIAANMPSTLFEFLKQGQNAQGVAQYDIDNLSLYTDHYIELAFGHQRELPALEGFSYGAKVKLLVGALGGSIDMEHIGINLSQERWYITSKGSAQLSSGMHFVYNENGDISNIAFGSYQLGGFGLGFDLGAAYTPQALPGLTVSLALTDIGFISWSDMERAVAGGTFEYTGFDNIGAPGQPEASEQLDGLLNDMAQVINVTPTTPATVTNSLRTTLNLGAEYAILSRKISFGILSSTRFGHPYTYAEGMAVVNFRPLSWLHLAINGSASTVGEALGALINICPKGVNIFAGCDYISPTTKFGAQGIPVNGANFNFRAGFAFTFGHRK